MNAEEKHSKWLRFHHFQQSREKFFAPKIHQALISQYKTFINHFRSQSDSTALLSISSEPIIKALQPLYLDAAIVYGAKIRADLMKQGRYAVSNILSTSPAPMVIKARMPIGFSEQMAGLIKDYFRTDILNTSEGITQTTRDLIQQVLQDAYDEGLGIDDIIKKLQDTELSRIRARLIARTETVTAANQGAFFAAIDTGLLLKKEWLTSNDNRVRPINTDSGGHHRQVNGNKIDMLDYFNVGGNKMLLPGSKIQESGLPTLPVEVCNCRCTCLYEPQRDKNGRLIRFDYGLSSATA